METGIVVVIILILLVGGALALLTRQGMVPWTLPLLRASGHGASLPGDERLSSERGLAAGSESGMERLAPTLFAEAPPANPLVRMPDRSDMSLSEPIRLDIAPSPSSTISASLEQIEERLESLQRTIERQDEELRRLRADLLARDAAEDGKREATLERLRADLLASLAGVVDRPSRLRDRRLDVSADLYARLARLESALAAVTNPILLPGEAYAPPSELMPESLVWDNWNEVGERAFALADAFSAQRLALSEEVREDVGRFVTAIRLLLTQSVYPNLQTDPDADQQAALHASLEEIAVDLPKVRAALDRDYLASQGN